MENVFQMKKMKLYITGKLVITHALYEEFQINLYLIQLKHELDIPKVCMAESDLGQQQHKQHVMALFSALNSGEKLFDDKVVKQGYFS